MAKKKKVRVDLRKNRLKPPRERGWTRSFQEHGFEEEATKGQERIRAKGDLSRRRTIIQDGTETSPEDGQTPAEMPAVDTSLCLPGRVLRVYGQTSVVETEDGRAFRCTVRRLLWTLAHDERNVVTTGDRVWILPAGPLTLPSSPGGEGSVWEPSPPGGEGRVREGEAVIERVEPRHGLLSRASRGRSHVIVANVDQVVIVVSLVEPELKPHLIDRYLASAEQGGMTPIVCLNKADLVDPADYQPLVGLYSQLGILTLLTSAATGLGVERLKRCLKGRETVFAGQSGVGKSSLLNAVQPGLGLRVAEVSDVNQKGKHTTTTADLLRLECGGWVVDTPGIRQFQLWDILPEEIEGFFPEFRPFVPLCAYPDCTHTHEDRCAVKDAIVRRLISDRRYTSYLGLFTGTEV